MIKIDLITGFLGSGKTTFIRKYAAWLMARGEKIGILENDFGAVNVDMLLLSDLEKAGCGLEMISGGSDAETHRRRFRTKLIAMGMSGYDRVLVEPSGIYDVDEFFDTLYDEPLDRWYEAGNVIAIVDAKLSETLSEESEYLLASETANAGCVLFSRAQETSGADMDKTTAHLNRALAAAQCARRFGDDIIRKNWDTLTDDDFKAIASCGWKQESFRKLHFDQREQYDSLFFMHVSGTKEALRTAVQHIFEEQACGKVFRVKGFMPLETKAETSEENVRGVSAEQPGGSAGMDERRRAAQCAGNGALKVGSGWLELNATKDEIQMKRAAAGQEVIIVIGEGLKKDAVRDCLTEAGCRIAEDAQQRDNA